MISKILIPTDGSKAAQKAAMRAIDLAKQLKASVFVLSVIDKHVLTVLQEMPVSDSTVVKTMFSLGTAKNAMKTIYEHMHDAAERRAIEIKKLCEKNKLQSKIVITTGHPAEEILKVAEKLKVDLIVMGSHGRSSLVAAVLGSVAYGVIHQDTKIPVMVVRIEKKARKVVGDTKNVSAIFA
ncbi:MAG: hypothetical protein A2X78_03740 [Gammaproteobacteria bacterium GWE2_37_16]|nr:MAG: hypothetical protein A2X78_03740 [Gammaproteobacteria bacterium GWE2_37_16]